MKFLKSIKGWASGLIVCALLVTLASCQNQDKYSDPQIASIAVTANQIDVDYGQIALEKSSNSVVRKFAQTMIDDHTDIINQAVDLAGKLELTPDDDNDFTKKLLEDSEKMKEKLNGLSGEEFDKAYIQNEADYHESVVGAVKDILIPQSDNADLKSLLESAVPLLEHHLEMAKEDNEKVQKGEGSSDVELDDAQIASAAIGANLIDVDYGKIALDKSENETVRNFAETMIKDHEGIAKAATELAGKLGVTPDDDNPLTQTLSKQAEETKEKLNGLSGDEFDKAYIDNEVAFHEAVIDAVKNTLIPQTQNEELKSTLESVLPNLEHHLEMAKEDQAKINE